MKKGGAPARSAFFDQTCEPGDSLGDSVTAATAAAATATTAVAAATAGAATATTAVASTTAGAATAATAVAATTAAGTTTAAAEAAATGAATAATEAATPAGAATAATKATRALFARTGFIVHQRAAVEGLAIHSVDAGLRLGIGAHFHEAEALGTARVAIHHDLGGRDRTELCERLLQIFVAYAVREVADIKFIAHG